MTFPTALSTDSDLFNALDRASSTLSADINTSVTTIGVADGTKFSSTGGIVLIGTELIKYTATSGNDLTTATRGYSGTTAASHVTGDTVTLVIGADYHNLLVDAIQALEVKVGIDSSAVTASHDYKLANIDGSWILVNTIDGTKLTSAAKKRVVFAQPHVVSGTTATLSTSGFDYGLAKFSGTSSVFHARVTLPIGTDFSSVSKAVVFVHSDQTANVRWLVTSSFAADGEARQTHTDSIAEATLAMTAGDIAAIDISSVLTGLLAGDIVGIDFQRNADHADDTITDLFIYLFLIEYTAT